MKDLKLQLSVSEVNLVLKALGNLPYYQVCTLIDKIQGQGNLQITPPNGNGHDVEHKAENTIHHS